MKFRHEHVLAMGVALLILVGLMLFAAGNANAALLSTNVLSAWDYSTFKYENGNARIIFDGDWVPFMHQIDFNTNTSTNQFPRDYSPLDTVLQYQACTPLSPTSSIYAGIDEISLYHTDNAPAGAPGFQSTQNWQLVKCDRDNDGDYDVDDLSVFPETSVVPAPAPACSFTMLYQDVVVGCTTGNCQDEIYSAFMLNCDLNCDQDLAVGGDDPAGEMAIPGGGWCVYWEAQKPTCGALTWGGNFQARLSGIAGGGDKTINFSIDCPTAVEVSSFGVTSSSPIMLGVLALGFGGVALLYWHSRRKS